MQVCVCVCVGGGGGGLRVVSAVVVPAAAASSSISIDGWSRTLRALRSALLKSVSGLLLFAPTGAGVRRRGARGAFAGSAEPFVDAA